MRLEGSSTSHEPEPKRNRALRLSEDELSAVLNDAIAGHSQVQRGPEHASTLEDALDIARQLDIPEEHVLAAARELQKRRVRELKRGVVRKQRKTSFLAALALGAVVALVVLLIKLSIGGVISGLVALLPAVYLGWRWLVSPVTDAEADAVELPPVPGQCRVCGNPAAAPRSTFCAEHQYRAPGAK